MLSEVFPIPPALGATESIVTAAASFVIAVILSWTSVVLYYHKSKWRPLDTLIFALLLECIAKQTVAVLYSCLVLLQPGQRPAWCPGITWLIASSHTLQAGTLTTLALSVLLKARMPPMKYRETLSKSHLVYHCGCLFVLSCCVGVAAILAQTRNDACVPHHDRRYLIFYLTLHSSLILSSIFSLIYSRCRPNNIDSSSSCRLHSKRLLLNSTSDVSSALSDISMISSSAKSKSLSVSDNNVGVRISYGDCDGCRRFNLVENLLEVPNRRSSAFRPRRVNSYLTSTSKQSTSRQFDTNRVVADKVISSTTPTEVNETKYLCCDADDCSTYARHKSIVYSSSYDTSSTNSRSIGYFNRYVIPDDIRFATVSAVICVAYLVDHVPVLASTMIMVAAPEYLPANWPYKTFPLWAALAEGCLIPIILFMFDEQFVTRVSSLYASSSSPEKGVYGKFRAYNSTLSDASPIDGETVRFPLTNGSLFTGIDGLPTVHIHRRPRGARTNNFITPPTLPQPSRPWYLANDPNLITSVKTNTSILPPSKQNIYSDDSDQQKHQNNRFATSKCSMKLETFDHPEMHEATEKIRQLRSILYNTNQQVDSEYECDSSVEEPIYATLSAYSTYSATTTANDDFEFFRHITSPDTVNTTSQHRTDHQLKMPYEKYNDHIQDDPCILSKHQILSRKTSPITRLNHALEQKTNQALQNKIKQEEYIKELDYRWCQPLDSAIESKLRHSTEAAHKIKLPITTSVSQQKCTMSMLSVDSLVNALNDTHISYLDTGDLYKHSSQCHASSVPDLKKIFITDFL